MTPERLLGAAARVAALAETLVAARPFADACPGCGWGEHTVAGLDEAIAIALDLEADLAGARAALELPEAA